ncbi:phosphatase PAP2 family protein [Haloferula sp. BvORR071]|uniref:phosphatase PAP2 family protein n=1 Tax=Haloferula sp. BvORR071 TaxID=1396141 RepID=UPI002240F46B|nr:phosphatase PAP2 family protein [Haloferula sp. BvORR071]
MIHRLGEWRRKPLGPLLLLAAAAGVLFFLKLASEVREDEFRRADEAILLMMREPGNPADPLGPPRVEEMARDLTALGSLTILTIVSTIGISSAFFAGRWKLALAGLVSVFSGMAVMNLLKSTYARARPDLVAHVTTVHDASFPSGHTTMASVVYLTLGIMIARTQARKRVRIFVIALSILITLAVGISRVYLGVHWPTDVLAGWALGTVWAVLFWFAVVNMDSRKARLAAAGH